MVRNIIHDIALLREKSQLATENDIPLANDLVDTLNANIERCVGMALNMIGIPKNVIAVSDNGKIVVMFNPTIVNRDGMFQTQEGCLSLKGLRPTVRYKKIEVSYQDMSFVSVKKKFSGWTAQIIQHEIDHLHGIII